MLPGVRTIVTGSLKVVESGRYGTDEGNCETWAINEATQYIHRKTGQSIQIITGWDCNPPDISGGKNQNKISKQNISQIADRITDESLLNFERKKKRNTLLLWVGIIGVIVALAVFIPLCYALTHGVIHVPTPNIDFMH